jgi:NADPH:quinone reductase-like Zn-dependent oxidoreductase
MKAVTYTDYGPPEVLQLREVDKPAPTAGEVLVEVHAAGVNYADWAFVRGKPALVRIMGSGLLKPKNPILGADIAGRIAAVGRNGGQFQLGDEVFGDISACGWGGFAEYVCAAEDALVLKPANASFAQAAAVPQAAVTALQGLRDEGQLQAGQKVLINGASGGIGTFAVQIAKAFGAAVTAVCGTRNVERVSAIGADQVIDYTREDFTQNGQRYDLIFDIVANRSVSDYVRALSPAGHYVACAFSPSAMLQGPWLSRRGEQKISHLSAKPCQDDLAFVRELIEAGQVVPVVDSCYPLSETAEAVRHYGARHAQGKIVVTVDHGSA